MTFNFFLFTFPDPVFAHVLTTNSTVGAVMHIDPEDDPIINQPANFYFEFKDTQNKFDLGKCDCKVSVKKGEQVVFNGKLEPSPGSSGGTSGTFVYTFPEKGQYKLEVDGDPTQPDDFSEFGLNYDLNITREKSPPPASSFPLSGDRGQNYNLYILGAGALVLFFLLYLGLKFLKK